MQLIENEITISTKHGLMPTFIVYPDEGPHPAVIFYMDAPGIREELRNMARRYARQGYCVLLPDLYYRLGKLRFDTHRRDEAMSVVIRTVRQSIDDAKVMDDTAAIFGYLDGRSQVKPGPAGVVGYCMSGSFVVAAAIHFSDRIRAAASFYGMNIVSEKTDSPHLHLDKVNAELYLAFAEHDPVVPDASLPVLRAALDAAAKKYDLERFSGTHHGFCFVERHVYDRPAAEIAWSKTLSLLSRTLRA